MSYASIDELTLGFRELTEAEKTQATALLDEAAVIVDSYNQNADTKAKKLVVCRLVRRQLGDGQTTGLPIGATQGTMSALGYSQSWTVGNGSYGEMYLTKLDKKLLGLGNRVSFVSSLGDNNDCN